ncbi:hypothetical protein BH20VER2_BH20VER2_18300 [soil metagenome]|nr:hypothetical protein [Chthoniobacterales bacterium]
MKDPDRVAAHTAESTNAWIKRAAERRVARHAADKKPALTRRIQELENEWDIERYLEMNASALAFTGVMLGLFKDRRFFLVPCLVLPFLFQHAVQGWCPPIPFFRKRGVRTRREIETEKNALKALRGDFGDVSATAAPRERARAAWQAANR